MKAKYWIIIILALAAGGFSWYYYLNSQIEVADNCVTPALQNQIKDFPKPENGKCPDGYTIKSSYCAAAPLWCEPDKAAASIPAEVLKGWKRYKNDDLGFEFQYPATAALATDANSVNLDFGGKSIKIYVVTGFRGYPSCYATEELKSSQRFGLYLWTSCASGWTTHDLKNRLWVVEIDRELANTNQDFIKQILFTFKFIDQSVYQEGSYKPGVVQVFIKEDKDRKALNKFIKDNNLEISIDLPNYNLLEIKVPVGKEQYFADLLISVEGVSSAGLAIYPSTGI